MITGLSASTFATLHTVLILVAVVSGFVVVLAALGVRNLEGWVALFLGLSILTSGAVLLFPHSPAAQPHLFSITSLIMLEPLLVAVHVHCISAAGRGLYVAVAILALALNAVVGVGQAIELLPFLSAAGALQQPALLIARIIVLAMFALLGVAAVRTMRSRADTVA